MLSVIWIVPTFDLYDLLSRERLWIATGGALEYLICYRSGPDLQMSDMARSHVDLNIFD